MAGTLSVLQPFSDFAGLGGATATTTSATQIILTAPSGYTLTLNGSFGAGPTGTVSDFVFANSSGTIASSDYGVDLSVLLLAIGTSNAAAAMTALLAGMDIFDFSDAPGAMTLTSLKANTTIIGNNFSSTITVLHSGVTINTGSGNDTITAGSGSTIDAGAGFNVINAGSAAILAGSTIDGGVGFGLSTLGLTTAGTYVAADFANVAHIDVIELKQDVSGWSLTLGDAMVATGGYTFDGTHKIGISGNLTQGVLIDASALSAGNGIVVEGYLNGNDTVTGGAGNDIFLVNGGNDSVVGGGGDDIFWLRAGAAVNAADTYDGGLGSDILRIDPAGFPNDLSSAGAIFHSIEKLHLIGVTGTQTILSQGQFGSGKISDSLVIDAESLTFTAIEMSLTVRSVSNFSAALWTLNRLVGGDLVITLEGASGTNDKTITGSNYRDVIDANGGTGNTLLGGGGNDTIRAGTAGDSINGGDGSDVIVVSGAAAFAGTTIDGGSQLAHDSLVLQGAGTYSFASFGSILGIDSIVLRGDDPGWVLPLTDALAGIADANSDSTAGDLEVRSDSSGSLHGVKVDASALTTGHWIAFDGNAGDDMVTGGAGADILRGYNGDDSFTAGDGDDTLAGGAGADTLKGGDGTDTVVFDGHWSDYAISFASGTYSFEKDGDVDLLTDIENVTFDDGTFALDNALFNADPIIAADLVGTGLTELGFAIAGEASASGGLLAGVSDANTIHGDTVRVGAALSKTLNGSFGNVSASVDTVIAGKYGSLTIHADGTYDYALDDTDADTNALMAGATADEVFTFKVTDLKGGFDTADLSFTITGSNDTPTGGDKTITIIEDGAPHTFSAADFGFADVDSDGALQSLTITSLPVAGTLKLDGIAVALNQSIALASIGLLVFTPAANGNGSPYGSFGFKVVDNHGAADAVANTIVFDVTGVNDAPVIANDGSAATVALIVGENATAVRTMTVLDVDGPTKIYTLSGTDKALFSISSTGVITFKAAPDFETPKDAGKDNVYTVTVMVSDGSLNDTQALTITVQNLAGNSFAGTSTNNTIDKTHGIGVKFATTEEDKIDGRAGNDTINGLAGNDTLIGGLGKDVLTGGLGLDKFVFNAALNATSNVDTIKDFTHDLDLIQLDDAIFKKIGAKLDAGEFYAKAGATAGHDASDRIIYDKATGRLYFDDDGNKAGGHAAVWFATLSTKPGNLDHGDFGIV